MAPFDTDKFIQEIEARPVVWNTTCLKFGNRLQRGKAWEELAVMFIPNFEKMDSAKKSNTIAGLQRRWKSLKDSFNRELGIIDKIKRGKMQDTGRKTYVYFKQLSFLNSRNKKASQENTSQSRSTCHERTSDNYSEDESQEDETNSVNQTAPTAPTPQPQKRKRVLEQNQIGGDLGRDLRRDLGGNLGGDLRRDLGGDLGRDLGGDLGRDLRMDLGRDLERELGGELGKDLRRDLGGLERGFHLLAANMEKITIALTAKDDPDRHFLMSLLPHYKTIPEQTKLDVQVDMINLIKRYQLQLYPRPY
ncbi:uncharacterized protein [Temnothorax longispinosus]|uniref:MADF domain-containing protein n=1 Tax=Temnothorax longispinosus TaxID=300112 RepID=A0A4S2JPC8_9HYME|nr:hypothetical protein DBV15_07513 [Temnothorax longispinosus]